MRSYPCDTSEVVAPASGNVLDLSQIPRLSVGWRIYANSRAPSLHGHYIRFSTTTRPSATLSPFNPFPGAAGYRAYLAPTISRRDEEGFSSCSVYPYHRAIAITPPKWIGRINQISSFHAAFARGAGARPSE